MKYLKILYLLTIFIFIQGVANALPLTYYDTVSVYEDIYIGDMNRDLIQDTVIGRAYSDYCMLPKYIIWGKDTTSTIPDSLRIVFSEIVFPKYRMTFSSSIITKSNYDSIPDIVFNFKGYYLDTIYTSTDTSIVKKDTSDMIVLFGQSFISKYPKI